MMQSFPGLPPHFKIYLVGGYVRDTELARIRGTEAPRCHDLDFTVVGPETFEEMVGGLVIAGFGVHIATPETFTVRCKVPESLPMLRSLSRDADFVLARSESSASNGRRPDCLAVGTLESDLARRDFTINAMAREVTPEGLGSLLDPHRGVVDLTANLLRFVGDPMRRLEEDALRLIRGLRFMVVKDLDAEIATWDALSSEEGAELLIARHPDSRRVVVVDRVRNEVEKMMASDTLATLSLLSELPEHTRLALFSDGLRLSATVKS